MKREYDVAAWYILEDLFHYFYIIYNINSRKAKTLLIWTNMNACSRSGL